MIKIIEMDRRWRRFYSIIVASSSTHQFIDNWSSKLALIKSIPYEYMIRIKRSGGEGEEVSIQFQKEISRLKTLPAASSRHQPLHRFEQISSNAIWSGPINRVAEFASDLRPRTSCRSRKSGPPLPSPHFSVPIKGSHGTNRAGISRQKRSTWRLRIGIVLVDPSQQDYFSDR